MTAKPFLLAFLLGATMWQQETNGKNKTPTEEQVLEPYRLLC